MPLSCSICICYISSVALGKSSLIFILLFYFSHSQYIRLFQLLLQKQFITHQKIMQIQDSTFGLQNKLLSSDQFLQSLFKQPINSLRQLFHEEVPHDDQKEPIKFDKEIVDKGYMSEGEQKIHTTHPNRRKNSIIRKIKIKQRKKKTRQTKIYMEMLQNRVLELQKSLQTATKLNQMNKEYLKKISQGQHIMNGLFVSKQRHIENLQFLLKQKEINNEALKKQYQNLRLRQGVYGKDRIKAINYYFSEMSEMFFTDTLKYLIKTAQNEEDFFDPELLRNGYYSHIKSPEDIVGNLKLPNESISELAYLKEQILAEKKVLDIQFSNFYNSKCEILKTARKMQMIIDSMQRYSNQEQVSKLIVFADQYRFKKNLSVKQFHKQVFDKQLRQKYEYDPANLFGIVPLT